MLPEFRRRFWHPPRAHGDIIEDRSVSFLELFYDLVYVVVIGQAAHHLAEHVTWQGVFDFAVIFGLIWIAWVNGTLYYDLHGREDGRTRVFVFIQMLILVVLAVYTGNAAGQTGQGFAIAYVVFLGVLSYLWFSIRRLDSDEYLASSTRYLASMLMTMIAMTITIFLTDDARMLVWTGIVVFWVVASFVFAQMTGMRSALAVNDSLVERYGLFVIIVLGEVVVGVVGGLSGADRNIETIATGLVGLSVGFAYWWTYFDFVGGRLPVDRPIHRMAWIFTHLPITMGVAAAGAAMVSLIEHGDETSTPEATAWLLSGSIAVALVALAATMGTLRDLRRYGQALKQVMGAMAITAGVILVIGWMAPAPWMLAGLLVAALMVLWLFAISRWIAVKKPTGTELQPDSLDDSP